MELTQTALGARRSAFGVRRSAFGARRSALGARRSALGARRSALPRLGCDDDWKLRGSADADRTSVTESRPPSAEPRQHSPVGLHGAGFCETAETRIVSQRREIGVAEHACGR